ncbi:MAG: hypothetical protein ACI9F9_001422 [Candidatus Paceibacteria bacterium]
MNDPEVLRASEDYVRILLRRPHAYFFRDNLYRGMLGVRMDELRGPILSDGSLPPIPGVYVLDADGALVGSSPIYAKSLRVLLSGQ